MTTNIESFSDKLVLKYTDSNGITFESVITTENPIVQEYSQGNLENFYEIVKDHTIIEKGKYCIMNISEHSIKIILKNDNIDFSFEEKITNEEKEFDDHISFNKKKLILFEEKFSEIQTELTKTRNEYSQFRKESLEIDFARNEVTKMQMDLLTKSIEKIDSISLFVSNLETRINTIDEKFEEFKLNFQKITESNTTPIINLLNKQEELRKLIEQVQSNSIDKISENITQCVSSLQTSIDTHASVIKNSIEPLSKISKDVTNIKSSIESIKEIPKISQKVETISKSFSPIKEEIEKVSASLDLQLITINQTNEIVNNIPNLTQPIKNVTDIIRSSIERLSFEPLKKNIDRIDLKLNYLDSSLWLFPNTVGKFDKISVDSQKSICAMFSLKLLTRNYVGPIARIRSGNRFQNFYADEEGNMGIALHGKGEKLQDWLGTGIAQVEIWYDQSGKEQHARQELFRSQPIINIQKKCMVFTEGRYFNLTNQTVPIKYCDQTIIVKHGIITNEKAVIFGLKQDLPEPLPFSVQHTTWVQNRKYFNTLERSGETYKNNLGDNETFEFTEYKNDNVISIKKSQKSIKAFTYGNCTTKKRIPDLPVQDEKFCIDYTIGYSLDKHNSVQYLDGELYSLFFFNSCIADVDYLIIKTD